MKPEVWLKALGAAYEKSIREDMFEAYLEELRGWILTDDEWISIRSIAKRRHTFFPAIAELHEIMREVRRDIATSSSNGDSVFETWLGGDGKWYAWPRRKGPRPVNS